MFHRRLLLLASVMLSLMGLLLLKTASLTLGSEHMQRREQAERALLSQQTASTIRGTIRDRNGVVLAHDQTGWDIAVGYDVLSGEWAELQARNAAIRALGNGEYSKGKGRWRELSPYERDQAVLVLLPTFQQQVEQMLQTLVGITGTERSRLDQNIRDLLQKIKLQRAYATQRNYEKLLERYGPEIEYADADTRLAEEFQKHPVIHDVSDTARLQVESFIASAQQAALEQQDQSVDLVWQEVEPAVSRNRRYPMETVTLLVDRRSFPPPLAHDEPVEITVPGVGMHLLGRLRSIHAGDALWQQRPYVRGDEPGNRAVDYGGYLDGDLIGAFGVEASMESTLRGKRGETLRRRDTGNVVSDHPATPGNDVTLTVDLRLQARMQALMSHDDRIGLMHARPWQKNTLPEGTPLNGAAVVLDIETSEVLAAVSVPAITLDQLDQRPQEIYSDFTNEPFVNRAVAYPYPPGSTMKPVAYAAGVSQGVVQSGWHFNCIGFHDANGDGIWQEAEPRCWIYKTYNSTHGEQSPNDAIKNSCNPYFFKLGEKLGPSQLIEAYHRFGLGKTHDCGLPEERPGIIPDASSLRVNDAVQMAIGQGPVTWTPLQAAGAYAAIVRGGLYVPPTFILGKQGEPTDLKLDETAVRELLQGMYRSANENGGTTYGINFSEGLSARIFNAPGLRIYAKSGTATAPPLYERTDTDGDGIADTRGEKLREGDHSWTIALAGPEDVPRPRYVVAVVCEYGGSGGRTAGPIANQVLRALQLEGYLPAGHVDAGDGMTHDPGLYTE
jgi:penicillin-binding protein 2